MGLKTICRPQDTNELQGSGELPWRQDTYKTADCIENPCEHADGEFPKSGGIIVRVDIDGLFAWLGDMHSGCGRNAVGRRLWFVQTTVYTSKRAAGTRGEEACEL